jgi:hypothetical protein
MVSRGSDTGVECRCAVAEAPRVVLCQYRDIGLTVSVGGHEGIVYENARPFMYSFFLLELFLSFLYYLSNCAALVIAEAWLGHNAA